MKLIPSGKSLPASLVVPGSSPTLVIEPRRLVTTPTLRRSIANATQSFAAIVAGTVNGSSCYDLKPGIAAAVQCRAVFQSPYSFEGHIRLGENIAYIFEKEQQVVDIQGDLLPSSYHSFVNRPVRRMIRHLILDPSEIIEAITTFESDDPLDREAAGTQIELKVPIVPLFPDIFEPIN